MGEVQEGGALLVGGGAEGDRRSPFALRGRNLAETLACGDEGVSGEDLRGYFAASWAMGASGATRRCIDSMLK